MRHVRTWRTTHELVRGSGGHVEDYSEAGLAGHHALVGLRCRRQWHDHSFEFLRQEIVDHECQRGCLIGNFGIEITDHSETIRAAVRQSLQIWGDLLAGAITEAQRAGSLRAGLDPRRTAGFLVNAWEGTLVEVRAERSEEPFDTFFDLVFGTLLT